jgi:hypothetical protein
MDDGIIECFPYENGDDKLIKEIVTVFTIYAPLTYNMYDSVHQIIRY